jgi:hypothetical protein
LKDRQHNGQKFEDTKEGNISRKSKNRQYNGQKLEETVNRRTGNTMVKRTKTDLQNITQKTTRYIHLRSEDNICHILLNNVIINKAKVLLPQT